MKATKSPRGFIFIMHKQYPPNGQESKLCSESSIIGNYDDAFDYPGSSALWIGENHHLNREEVTQLRDCLSYWLEHRRLPLSVPEPAVRDFCEGDFVTYVPIHAQGDLSHKDCEEGIVTAVNEHTVFVRFGTNKRSQGCSRETLVRR